MRNLNISNHVCELTVRCDTSIVGCAVEKETYQLQIIVQLKVEVIAQLLSNYRILGTCRENIWFVLVANVYTVGCNSDYS